MIINHTDGWGIKRVPLLLQMWFHTFLQIFKLNQKPRCRIMVLAYIMSVCDIPWRSLGLGDLPSNTFKIGPFITTSTVTLTPFLRKFNGFLTDLTALPDSNFYSILRPTP